jgi:uncharacterized protein
MVETSGFVPGQHGIDAYGSGGFKFAGMSHRGSILALPTGIHAFAATRFAEITAEALAPLLALPKGTVDLLLVGTGPDLVPLPETLRRRLREAGIRSDPMATGAAARTYNVLLSEGRRVAAALVAVA